MAPSTATLLTVVLLSLTMLSCTGSRPSLGVTNAMLTPCPGTPNCVSSDAQDDDHAIAPFVLQPDAPSPWGAVLEALNGMARTRIVSQTTSYLHAECTSLVFRFVDDVELHLRPQDGIIAVRSASRIGRSDFGVNRKRVEELRTRLVALGAVAAEASEQTP